MSKSAEQSPGGGALGGHLAALWLLGEHLVAALPLSDHSADFLSSHLLDHCSESARGDKWCRIEERGSKSELSFPIKVEKIIVKL